MTGKCTVTMTDKAYKYLVLCMERENKRFMRLQMKPTGCSGWEYVTTFEDKALEGDYSFVSRGIQLCIPDNQLIHFNGSCMDLKKESLGQTKIVFNNPNAMDHCGCGDSFALKDKSENE